MNARNDLLFVVMVVITLGVVWFATGGPGRIESQGGFFLSPPPPLGTGEVYGVAREQSGARVPQDVIGIEQEIETTEQELERVRRELQNIEKFGETSPYDGQVAIEKWTTGVGEDDPDKEYISLRAHWGNNKNISITNWKLESVVTRKKITIGKGTAVLQLGQINGEENIVVKPGDAVYISTGRSPVGVSFLTNKCTGYLEQFQNFNPALSKECPYANDEADLFAGGGYLSDECYDVLERLPRCEMPVGSLSPFLGAECHAFIGSDVHYSGCVKNHRNDTDFRGDEWRIFLSRNEELWKEKREVIRLLDAEGKTVDVFSY